MEDKKWRISTEKRSPGEIGRDEASGWEQRGVLMSGSVTGWVPLAAVPTVRTPCNLCHWVSQWWHYDSPQLLRWGAPMNPTVFIDVDSTEDSYHLRHRGNQQLQTLERETLTPPDPSPRGRATAGLPLALGSRPPPALHLPWTLEPTLLGTLVLGQFSLGLHSRFRLRGCSAHTTLQSPGPLSVQASLHPGLRDVSSAHPDPKYTATQGAPTSKALRNLIAPGTSPLIQSSGHSPEQIDLKCSQAKKSMVTLWGDEYANYLIMVIISQFYTYINIT